MSGLETAIRHALERAERANSETRARIYQSARNALEAGLRKQDVHDPDVVAQQRHRLEAVIHAIELEERAALRTAASVAPPQATRQEPVDPLPPVELDDGMRGRADRTMSADEAPVPDGRLDGRLDGGLDGLRAERRMAAAETPAPIPASDRRGRKARKADPKPRRRRSSFLSFVMVVTVLVAAVGTAAWWVQTSGLLKSPAERDTSVANPPATVRSEDFDGGAGLRTLGSRSGFSGDWIDVFTPAEADKITAGSQAAADPVSDEKGQRLRITSATAGAGGNVLVEIPASVLEQISGKTSTLALSVRADEGKPTQFSVECDFSTLGDCGRHRFTALDEKNDMVFKVTFDRSLAPNAPGHILINSDVDGVGKSLSLYAVRVLPGQ